MTDSVLNELGTKTPISVA